MVMENSAKGMYLVSVQIINNCAVVLKWKNIAVTVKQVLFSIPKKLVSDFYSFTLLETDKLSFMEKKTKKYEQKTINKHC